MVRCTVAIPVYNRPHLVRHALDSALAQDVPGLEILVVDNCSTDNTWETLQTYSDPRLRLERNAENVGLFGNFNRCLALARGEYLRFLCSDDRLAPGCLHDEISLMDTMPTAAFLSTRGRRLDPGGRVTAAYANQFAPGLYAGADLICAALWFIIFYSKNPLNCPSGVLIRRAAAQAAGEFDPLIPVGGDLDYYFRLCEQGDAAISYTMGCDVTVHPEQAAVGYSRDGSAIRDLRTILLRHAPLLRQRGVYESLLRQLPGCASWLSLHLWRSGLPRTLEFSRTLAECGVEGRTSGFLGATRDRVPTPIFKADGPLSCASPANGFISSPPHNGK